MCYFLDSLRSGTVSTDRWNETETARDKSVRWVVSGSRLLTRDVDERRLR
jgi:hypothetical protein